MISVLRKVRRGAELLAGSERSWERLEYFSESWKMRIEEMARFISPGESVVDLGCGKMWLRPLLKNNTYWGVDYKQRDANTTVVDFNKHEYPNIEAEVAFVSGTLEYIEDYEWFVRQVRLHSRKCIVSYCTTEQFPDLKMRKQKAWKNHLSRSALLQVFVENGMRLEAESVAVPQNPVFVFSRKND